jgi:hypothetical protein
VDGLDLTFWDYCPHASAEPSPEVLGRSLRSLHDALEAYADPLRPWDQFNGVGRVLADQAALSALPPNDRAFLRQLYIELVSRIGSFHPDTAVARGASRRESAAVPSRSALDRLRISVYGPPGVGPDRPSG